MNHIETALPERNVEVEIAFGREQKGKGSKATKRTSDMTFYSYVKANRTEFCSRQSFLPVKQRNP